MNARRDAIHALDSQLGIISHFKSELGQRTCVYFMDSQLSSQSFKDAMDKATANDDERVETAVNNGLRMAHEIATNLNHAQTYLMSEQMMALNLHAGESVPNSPFHYDNLPAPAGFLMLPRPLIMQDIHGLLMSNRAIAWWTSEVNKKSFLQPEGVITRCLMIALFSNKNDWKNDSYLAQAHDEHYDQWIQGPEWMLAHWQNLEFGRGWLPDEDDLEAIRNLIEEEGGKELTGSLGSHKGLLKERLGIKNANDEEVTDTLQTLIGNLKADPRKVFEWLAFLKSFFLLVNQEIAVFNPHPLDRATARRLQRMKKPPEFGDIQVVVLRRERPHKEEEITDGTPLNWTHRWIVSGHWRNQWYPKKGRNEPIWINAYEKGPEHLPLVVKDKVFIWKR